MPRTLPWPMTRIDRDVLHELWLEAKRTGQPITAIVKTAVEAHLNHRLEQAAPSPPADPQTGNAA